MSDKQKKKDKKQKKQKTDSSAESGSGDTSRQASPAAPAPIEFKLFKTMDEGQKLRVNGKEHKNCCLPLALARATLGEAAGKEEIQAWASDWVAKLPENKQKACRLPAREAELGEALYDDYLQFEIDAAPRSGPRTRPQRWKTSSHCTSAMRAATSRLLSRRVKTFPRC